MSPLTYYRWSGQQQFIIGIPLNFSSIATLGTEESGHCKEVDVGERFALPTKTTLLQTLPELSLRGRNPQHLLQLL